MSKGWTLERRQRQAELIRGWKPWEQSTGPKSEEGRAKASRNAWKGGHREAMRGLARMVQAEIRNAKSLLSDSSFTHLSF